MLLDDSTGRQDQIAEALRSGIEQYLVPAVDGEGQKNIR